MHRPVRQITAPAAEAPQLLEGSIVPHGLGPTWFDIAVHAIQNDQTVDVAGVCRRASMHLYDFRDDSTRLMTVRVGSMFDIGPRPVRRYEDAMIGRISARGLGIYRPTTMEQVHTELEAGRDVVRLGWLDMIDAPDLDFIRPHEAAN